MSIMLEEVMRSKRRFDASGRPATCAIAHEIAYRQATNARARPDLQTSVKTTDPGSIQASATKGWVGRHLGAVPDLRSFLRWLSARHA